MSDILQDLSPGALATAIEANLRQQMLTLARLPGAELHDGPDMTWLITGLPWPPFNGVFRARLSPAEADDAVQVTLARFKARRAPMIWWTGPSTWPADLGPRLQARGLIHAVSEPGMAVDLRALNDDFPPVPGLSIARAGNAQMLQQWVRPVARSFNLPDGVAQAFYENEAAAGFEAGRPAGHYVAFMGEEPVGASLLFLAEGVAGVHWVATVPEARRRGIGTAVTLAALREAQALGYRVGVLHSSEKGLGVYRRLGFEEYCRVSQYVYVRGKAQRTKLRTYHWVQGARAGRGGG